MKTLLKKFTKRRMREDPKPSPRCQLVLASSVIPALQACLSLDIRRRHEGIAYLLGRTDGLITLAVAVIKPAAVTTAGSFYVSSVAMAHVVRTAADCNLQVVGQVHTHPQSAFHSDGDIDGARIAYSGYVSMVLPDYGQHLPSLEKAAYFVYCGSRGFSSLDAKHVSVVPGRVA